MLEELEAQYNAIPINIGNNEQFQKEFTKISPSNKIPAIFDHETQTSIFESGAIMLYLADKYDKFLPKKTYWITMEWFMFQLTQVGPILGQAHQFLYYHPGQGEFVENKYRFRKTGIKNRTFLNANYSWQNIAAKYIENFKV